MNRSRPDWRPFVLLLIDMQRSFWGLDTPTHTARAAAFPHFPDNIVRLVRVCRAEGIAIVHIRSQFEPDRSDWMVPFKLRRTTPCVVGSVGWETLPFAQERTHEPVFVKHTLDAFHNEALLAYLRQRQTRFVLTAGLVTSTCVLLTTASAMQHGMLTAMVEDCCADDVGAHEHTLTHYAFMTDRTTSERLVEDYAAWQRALDAVG